MKAVLLLDDIGYIIVIVIMAFYIVSLRKRMRGLDQPELWLPRKERQAHARKLLKREDEEYQERMLAHFTEVIGEQLKKEV